MSRPSWLLPCKQTVLEALPIRAVGTHVDRERIKDKHSRWWYGPKGARWKLTNRETRNAYHRKYYRRNLAKRRAYLNSKQREYRAAK